MAGITLKTDLLAESREVMEALKTQTNKSSLTAADVRQLGNINAAINKAIWELREYQVFFQYRKNDRDRSYTPEQAKQKVINEGQLMVKLGEKLLKEKLMEEVTLDESKGNRRFISGKRVDF